MKIAFCCQHPYWGGLNDNGGSLTILKAARALKNLGHKAVVVASSDNCTWIKHDKPVKKIPKDTDVCIAVSCTDIGMMKFDGLRAVWLRGWERWRHNSKKIITMVSGIDRVFVNSEWLQNKLLESNVPSTIIHQGIDFDQWPDNNQRNKKLTIGCLYHRMESKGWKDFVELQKRLGNRYRYVAYGGNRCRDKFLSKYMLQPTHKQLLKLYNMCHFWFVPSCLEGLANPPMEASLCGAAIVAINKRSGGTGDWLTHAYSGFTYNKVKEAADWLMSPAVIAKDKFIKNAQHNIREKIGSRESNMKKFVEVLS